MRRAAVGENSPAGQVGKQHPGGGAPRDADDHSDKALRERYGPRCPVHLVAEPCPTCESYIAAGL